MTGNHPCFHAEAKGRFGRVHLPVAASCNIRCAYCRRDHACPNENRPGVASELLSPAAALERLESALARMPYISVAGIAGPGDAFCDPEPSLETFELIRRKYPEIALCVSSNGLNVKDSIGALRELYVRFVTITVNTLDPIIGARLYKRVRFAGKVLTGEPAAQLLIERQLEAISLLKAAGITVKVNAVVVPGVNDEHLPFLAGRMGRMGVDLMNLLPIIPVPGTDMAHIVPPPPSRVRRLREKAERHLPMMHHCMRCRSDAAGLLREEACNRAAEAG